MRARALAALALAVLLIASPAHAAKTTGHRHHYRVGLIARDNVRVRAHASAGSAILAVLVEQTEIEVLGYQHAWAHVRIWGSVRGWVQRADITFRKPVYVRSHYQAPEIHQQVHASPPRSLTASALAGSPTDLVKEPGGKPQAVLPAGSLVPVTSWQQDGSGTVWYRIRGLWAHSDTLALVRPRPHTAHGRPLWAPVSGKGMWLTLGIVATSSPAAIVRAAQRGHITHLYVESAISPLGFHGRNTVGHLLGAAHAAHIAVIAWVYPYLADVAADVKLTAEVAEFRTPEGTRFDGIAADLERNMTPQAIGAYSDLVRATLGTQYLLVGVTYPPQSLPGYPFAEVGRAFDVVAPMDYWHQTRTPYGLDYGHMRYGWSYGYRYALDSINRIRATVGKVPIEPIGQTFDNFGRMEMGPYAPSAAEVQGFLEGARAGGAIGVSFFEWTSATPSEWAVIRRFSY